mgnify:CR=1 FL=1
MAAAGLLPREISEVRRLVQLISPLLAPQMAEVMNDYVEGAIIEQAAGTLWLHEDDVWCDGHSYRYGRQSVYGTLGEWLGQGKLEAAGCIWSFDHSYTGQVINHLDGHITSPAGTSNVTAKLTHYNAAHDGHRLGADYFPVGSDADMMMLSDLTTMTVYLCDYKLLHRYFLAHAVPDREHNYCYRPIADILLHSNGVVL